MKCASVISVYKRSYFERGFFNLLLTYTNALAVQALLKNPDKIATAMAIFDTHNLADSRRIQLLLAHGGVAAIKAFLEDPQKLAEALQTVASDNGFTESSMIVLLTYANALAVQALLKNPDKIATAMTIFDTHNLADSRRIPHLLAQGGVAASRLFSRTRKNLPRHCRQWLLTMASQSRR